LRGRSSARETGPGPKFQTKGLRDVEIEKVTNAPGLVQVAVTIDTGGEEAPEAIGHSVDQALEGTAAGAEIRGLEWRRSHELGEDPAVTLLCERDQLAATVAYPREFDSASV